MTARAVCSRRLAPSVVNLAGASSRITIGGASVSVDARLGRAGGERRHGLFPRGA